VKESRDLVSVLRRCANTSDVAIFAAIVLVQLQLQAEINVVNTELLALSESYKL